MASRSARASSLIDWDDPDRNARILDWRSRARDFGLLPVGGEDGEPDAPGVGVPHAPEQLLHDEEPEAFDDQSTDESEEEFERPTPPADEAAPEAEAADADLVRT
jgi:hypothetical protein